MKHSGIMLGVALTMITASGLCAHVAKPTKPHLSVNANLNPQLLLPRHKNGDDQGELDEPPVLEKGSRVVASNTPDEDFVILGSLQPILPDPPHIETDAEKQTQTDELVSKTLADAKPRLSEPVGPPALLKAPVEVKAGIQPDVSSQAVAVAGPNIGAAPAVTPDKIETSTEAVRVASAAPVTEASALKPPPAVDLFLQKPEKPVTVAAVQKPVLAIKPPANIALKTRVKAPVNEVVKEAVKEAVVTPAKTPVKATIKEAAKTPVKAKTLVKVATKTPVKKVPVKAPVTVAVKTPAKALLKTPVKIAIAQKAKHLMAKVNPPKLKPVHLALAPHHKPSKPIITPAKTQLAFASYHPPKHSKSTMPKVVSVKFAKASFKPVIKPFKPKTLHVERKSHFHPVIKPYIAS